MKNDLIKKLEILEEVDDVYFDVTDNDIGITFNDFGGFDKNWCEKDREYTEPDLVKEVQDFLENNCLSKEGDFYYYYYFEDFEVQVGYSSYDI